jgi:hypothetical protein
MKDTVHLHLMPGLGMSGTIPLFPLIFLHGTDRGIVYLGQDPVILRLCTHQLRQMVMLARMELFIQQSTIVTQG